MKALLLIASEKSGYQVVLLSEKKKGEERKEILAPLSIMGVSIYMHYSVPKENQKVYQWAHALCPSLECL